MLDDVSDGQPAILVVDDERPIVDLLTRYLRQHGCRAVGAYSAAEARQKVAADPAIAVVVSDVRMPGQSGLALAEELMCGRAEADAIEIVLISGASIGEGNGTAWRERAFDVLLKPFRPSEVATVAGRALAACRERRARAGLAEAMPRIAAPKRRLTPATLSALRQPLLPILAAAEALATGAAADVAEARGQAQRIREGAMQLLALIDTAETALAEPQPLQAVAGGRSWVAV